ncbi:hypothetical protein AX17_002865 [Amanita inopinata Kibby_2008]|nr:hypothetical protein AX17_002865 [Amanita inopinata Kibby_2008]
MQRATYQRLHVRNAHDAHVVFEAVRQGFLSPIVARLNEMERSNLVRSGAIFVWFEGEDDSGLKRWTDGRVWGQSRMREPYLFYDEKLPSALRQGHINDTSTRSTYRFVDGMSRNAPVSSAVSHQDRCPNPHSGLVKQAYSAWVMPHPDAKPQKWHLTAYFTYADLPHLPTIDDDSVLSRIILPHGIYRSGKTRFRNDEEVRGSSHPAGLPHPDGNLPPLSTLEMPIDPLDLPVTQPRPHSHRISEDQRVIDLLNSRHFW